MTSSTGSFEADAASAAAALAFRASLVALPFLFPIVAGPSVNVWQLLASWACLAGWLFLGPTGLPARGVWVLLATGSAVVALSGMGVAATSAWIPACVALAGIAAAAALGTGLVRAGPQARTSVAIGLLAAGLVSTLLGLLQYYGFAHLLAPWTTAPDPGVAYGNLRQRNQFATLISMALVAALWLHATQPALRVRRWLMAAAVLLVVAEAASTSRTGLVQLLAIVAAASFIAWRERRSGATDLRLPSPWLLLALIPLYLVLAWLLPELAGHDVQGMFHRLRVGDTEDHGRVFLWRNVLYLIAQHPWTGWGWGELSHAHYSTAYPEPRFAEILDSAHDLPLHLAVELGLPAAALICGGFIWMVMRAQPWRERDPLRLMAWGMLGAIVLHSLLEYPLWYGPFQLVFGLCLGMLWPGVAPDGHRRFSARRLSTAAGVLLTIVVGYTGWDYIRISQIYLPQSERLPPYEDNTLAKLRGSWIFANQVDFAELTLTTLTPSNAEAMHAQAERLVHFSPEPRVVVKLIESAELLGHEDEAKAQAARFRDAFPKDYARWLKDRAGDDQSP